MKKTEVLALVEKLNMEPLMIATNYRECYGEIVVINGYQAGFQLDSDDPVPELEALMGPAEKDGPVVLDRLVAGTKFYRYQMFTPSSWFEKEV